MLKKTIKYNDYNGVEREDTFFFNLTRAEITEMELSVDGGLADKIKSIIEAKNTPEIIKIFKKLILQSYGEKTSDGKRFRKNDNDGTALSLSFSETEAYSKLFMELATDDNAASDFVNGIIPDNLDKVQVKEIENNSQSKKTE